MWQNRSAIATATATATASFNTMRSLPTSGWSMSKTYPHILVLRPPPPFRLPPPIWEPPPFVCSAAVQIDVAVTSILNGNLRQEL